MLAARIKRGLQHHLLELGFVKNEQGLFEPPELTKDCFRELHYAQRKELLEKESQFVTVNWNDLKSYLANGSDIDPRRITPRLEIIKAGTWQSRLFRMVSLCWSVPVSQGYGRRMRFLVWDDSNGKLIGLAALGDPVFNMRVRDTWVGWNLKQREQKLVNVLDAYVLGAVPPYNMLLGTKLIASLLATQEVKELFAKRYGRTKGIISKKRKRAELCLITTTSSLGRSSVYNRVRLSGRDILSSIGYTSGWGHFHIPDKLFALMRVYLKAASDEYANNHRFGDGPNWKMRAVRKVLSMIGMDPDLMRHGIAREVFVCPLANNAQAFLSGIDSEPDFAQLPNSAAIAAAALTRWVMPRAERKPEYKNWRVEDTYAMINSGEKSEAKVMIAKTA